MIEFAKCGHATTAKSMPETSQLPIQVSSSALRDSGAPAEMVAIHSLPPSDRAQKTSKASIDADFVHSRALAGGDVRTDDRSQSPPQRGIAEFAPECRSPKHAAWPFPCSRPRANPRN